MAIEQSTWNLLFGWTGRRCFIPEGCTPPVEGVIVYTASAAMVAAAFYLGYRHRDKVSSWIR